MIALVDGMIFDAIRIGSFDCIEKPHTILGLGEAPTAHFIVAGAVGEAIHSLTLPSNDDDFGNKNYFFHFWDTKSLAGYACDVGTDKQLYQSQFGHERDFIDGPTALFEVAELFGRCPRHISALEDIACELLGSGKVDYALATKIFLNAQNRIPPPCTTELANRVLKLALAPRNQGIDDLEL
jgi:hypothetical protein